MLSVSFVGAIQEEFAVGREEMRGVSEESLGGFPRRDMNHIDAKDRIDGGDFPERVAGIERKGGKEIREVGFFSPCLDGFAR